MQIKIEIRYIFTEQIGHSHTHENIILQVANVCANNSCNIHGSINEFKYVKN